MIDEGDYSMSYIDVMRVNITKWVRPLSKPMKK